MSNDKCKKGDVLYAGPAGPNGTFPFIRHLPDHKTEMGIAKPVKNGEPLHGGAVLLEARPDEPGTFDVHSVDAGGPPKVTSDDYREGWDRIFGGKQPVGQA